MNQASLIKRISAYQEHPPEEIFHWHDPQSSAEGILVIDSWAYGACGGGTRITETLNTQEVVALAKVMGLKFQLFGPQMGGAKSCLAIASDYPDKAGVLARWFSAIKPFLQRGYGTAADLNTDFSMIAQQFQQMGYCHPQQGIWQALGMPKVACDRAARHMQVLHLPVALGHVTIPLAELVTGYGIAQSIYAAYGAGQEAITSKHAIVQGVGTVGAAAAYYLHQLGVRVIGLMDITGGVIASDGFSTEMLERLLQSHQLTAITPHILQRDAFYRQLAKERVEIIVPAACAYLNDRHLVEQWLAQGLEIIACGANLPFHNEALFGPIAQWLDQTITLIPSCVASGGMARAFSMIMQWQQSTLLPSQVLQDCQTRMAEIIQPAVLAYGGRRVAEQCYAQALKEFHPEKCG